MRSPLVMPPWMPFAAGLMPALGPAPLVPVWKSRPLMVASRAASPSDSQFPPLSTDDYLCQIGAAYHIEIFSRFARDLYKSIKRLTCLVKVITVVAIRCFDRLNLLFEE